MKEKLEKKNKDLILKNKNKINENLENYWDGIEHLNKLTKFIKENKQDYNDNVRQGLKFAKLVLETNFDILTDFYRLFSKLENYEYIKDEKKGLVKENLELKYPKFEKKGIIVLETGTLDLKDLERLY